MSLLTKKTHTAYEEIHERAYAQFKKSGRTAWSVDAKDLEVRVAEISAVISKMRVQIGYELSILFLGCGDGCIAIPVAGLHRGISVTGIDIAPTAIASAKLSAQRHGLAANFVCGSVLEL
jgi:2-polyprenyl-3-methyl-5-hydroxy-6-metoxy-1,4-benzoquinol methylase